MIDELVRPNPDDPTGKSMMRRVPEVLDVWFDSGSMPFAQEHYPFENKERFDRNFPADFIVEYVGPDPWLVLHADGPVDGDLRSRTVPQCGLPRCGSGREQAEAFQAASELSGPGRRVQHLRSRCAALVHAVLAAACWRRSGGGQGRARHRPGPASGDHSDLERLLLLHALCERGQVQGRGALRPEGPSRSLHSRQDARADREDPGARSTATTSRAPTPMFPVTSTRSTTGTSAVRARASGAMDWIRTRRTRSIRSTRF